MPETPIEPALTAEEWAHQPSPQQIGWACGEVFVGEGPSLDTVNRHGLAALCLYGQPFGFTREDVELLRGAADWSESTPEEIALRSLADRLESLLPPA